MEVILLLKIIFSLAVVVSLLFVFSYLLKNYLVKFGHHGSSEDIKIRDIKFIARDKGLATFEFDEKVFLIAFDNTKISLLHKKNLDPGENGSDN